MSIFTEPQTILQEGERLDRVKDHIKRNWVKYLVAAPAAAYTMQKPESVGKTIGKTAKSLVASPGIITKTVKGVGSGIAKGWKGETT